jgi:DNA-binding NarL/FixJ family response regulator
VAPPDCDGDDELKGRGRLSERKKTRLRVLLATHSTDLGDALCVYLHERRVEVVGVVDDMHCLLACVAATHPDAVLIDWRLGAGVSSQAVADLQSDAGTPAVILSTSRDESRARRSGAAAVATLGDSPARLLAALEEVSRATA